MDIQDTQPKTRPGTQVREDGDLKKYRTETPNLVYELRLTPYELALYSHLKRTAGAVSGGRCYKATDTLAEEADMSKGAFSKAKKGLCRTDRPGLNGKSLIHVEKDDSRPGRARDIITIVDIWPENFLFFAKQSSPQSSYSELQSSPQSSYSEPKNKSESLKKELIEEGTEETLNVSAGQANKPQAALPAEGETTLNASSPGVKTLFSGDETDDETDDETETVSGDANLPPLPLPLPQGEPAPAAPRRGLPKLGSRSPGQAALSLKAQEVERIARITGDEGSRRRWEQVYDLAEQAGLLLLWDKARAATCKAVQKAQADSAPLNAGKYFNGVIGKLLNEAHPGLIPVGSREERQAVRDLARASLAAAENPRPSPRPP